MSAVDRWLVHVDFHKAGNMNRGVSWVSPDFLVGTINKSEVEKLDSFPILFRLQNWKKLVGDEECGYLFFNVYNSSNFSNQEIKRTFKLEDPSTDFWGDFFGQEISNLFKKDRKNIENFLLKSGLAITNTKDCLKDLRIKKNTEVSFSLYIRDKNGKEYKSEYSFKEHHKKKYLEVSCQDVNFSIKSNDEESEFVISLIEEDKDRKDINLTLSSAKTVEMRDMLFSEYFKKHNEDFIKFLTNPHLINVDDVISSHNKIADTVLKINEFLESLFEKKHRGVRVR